MINDTTSTLLALLILYYFTSCREDFTMEEIDEMAESMAKKRENFNMSDIEKLADDITKGIDDIVEETKPSKKQQVIKTGVEPLRIKSNPDVRPDVAYKKNGDEKEATANGAGWATCVDSSRSGDVDANKEKAIELCEEWHKSNTPHMAFGDNSGDFVCKIINSEFDKKDGTSRAKACPHVRIVGKHVVN